MKEREYTPEETQFAVFCMENVARQLRTEAVTVHDAWTKETDILEGCIIPSYDVLHSPGKEYIVRDLIGLMKEKASPHDCLSRFRQRGRKA